MREYYQMINDKEKRDFLRMNPIWYKEMNRDFGSYEHFKQTFEVVKKERTPSKMEAMDKHLNTAKLVLRLIQGLK